MLTQVGLDTFADPIREGCAMNASAAARPIVARVEFGGETWLHFPNIVPDVAILRATTADEHGNLTYEHEGATRRTRSGDRGPQPWRARHRAGEAGDGGGIAAAA